MNERLLAEQKQMSKSMADYLKKFCRVGEHTDFYRYDTSKCFGELIKNDG